MPFLFVGLLGVALIAVSLWDAFETIILPRRVSRRVRLTRAFYRSTWAPYQFIAKRIAIVRRREKFLGVYGPISLILLLCVWALCLIVGFAAVQWALGTKVNAPEGAPTFGTFLYMSGTTFFTLGYGDVTPFGPLGRALDVIEGGVGFGFLAIVIGYLPVVYGAFSRREVNISLLDARAGSPPTAAELLRRHGQHDGMKELTDLLRDWEKWSSELMESHLSYPVVCYYRSQHTNQSWLAALTTILDTCALVMVGIDGSGPTWQAELTFAMARHAVVDIAQIFNTSPNERPQDRLPSDALARLRARLAEAGVPLREGAEADRKLSEIRKKYEPYVNALADYLLMVLPPWVLTSDTIDNWQTTAWEKRPQNLALAGSAPPSILPEAVKREHSW
jgi:hypothetical protein